MQIPNGSVGVVADSDSKVTVTNSVITNGLFGAQAAGGLPASDLMVTRSTIVGATFSLVAAALAGDVARVVADGNALNDASAEAFHYGAVGGTEVIYTAGNNTVRFNNGISNGPLTPIGTH
jgi:hypothetical protein